jgi:hypothetical protein
VCYHNDKPESVKLMTSVTRKIPVLNITVLTKREVGGGFGCTGSSAR